MKTNPPLKALPPVVDPPEFKMKMHLNLGEGGIMIHRCEELKLTCETFTPKKKNGEWGRGTQSSGRRDHEDS